MRAVASLTCLGCGQSIGGANQCKNGTDLLYDHAKHGGDRGSRAGCRRKSAMFFVCLFVMLWNYKVCDSGNAMKQYYYQNNYGVIACRKVCSCAPILNFFCGPPKFWPPQWSISATPLHRSCTDFIDQYLKVSRQDFILSKCFAPCLMLTQNWLMRCLSSMLNPISVMALCLTSSLHWS